MANKVFASNDDFKNNVMARWGGEVWRISRKQAKPLTDAGVEIDYDTSGKKKKVVIEATLTYPLYKELIPSADIAGIIFQWRKRVKKKAPLYIGNVALAGARKYRLDNVKVRNIDVYNGEMVHCVIDLTFKAAGKSYSLKKYKRVYKKTYKKKRAKKLKKIK